MDRLKTGLAGLGLIGIVWLQFGCAQILVPGAMAGAGEVYRYTTSNVAKQSFVGDTARVTAAAKETFEKMQIDLKKIDEKQDKTVLSGTTPELDITVKIEPVNPTISRVVVTATKDTVFKDKATANEILSQMAQVLAAPPEPEKKSTSVFVKNTCDRPVKVAVYYLAGPEGAETWGARGWFFVDAGRKKHIADTKNRYVYLYAESGERERLLWAGDHSHNFKGKSYGFFKVDMGRDFTDFTQSLTCD